MLLLSQLFGCEDSMLTIVALMICPKAIWSAREKPEDYQAFFSKIEELSGGQLSDHILQLKLFEEWSLRFGFSFDSKKPHSKTQKSAQFIAEQREWHKAHNLTQGFMNEVASIRTDLKRKFDKIKRSSFEVEHVPESLNLRIKMCLAGSSPFWIAQVSSDSSLLELTTEENCSNIQMSNTVLVSHPDLHNLFQKMSVEFPSIKKSEMLRILKEEIVFQAERFYGKVSKVIIEAKSAFIEFEEGVGSKVIKELRRNYNLNSGKHSFGGQPMIRGTFDNKILSDQFNKEQSRPGEETILRELRLRIQASLSSASIVLKPVETIALTNSVSAAELSLDPTSQANMLHSDSLKSLARADEQLLQLLTIHYLQRAVTPPMAEDQWDEDNWMGDGLQNRDTKATYAIYSQITPNRSAVASQCSVLPSYPGFVQMVLLIFAPQTYLEIGEMKVVEKLHFGESKGFRIRHWMDRNDLSDCNSARTMLRSYYLSGIADKCVWDTIVGLLLRRRPEFVDIGQGFEGFMQCSKVVNAINQNRAIVEGLPNNTVGDGKGKTSAKDFMNEICMDGWVSDVKPYLHLTEVYNQWKKRVLEE